MKSGKNKKKIFSITRRGSSKPGFHCIEIDYDDNGNESIILYFGKEGEFDFNNFPTEYFPYLAQARVDLQKRTLVIREKEAMIQAINEIQLYYDFKKDASYLDLLKTKLKEKSVLENKLFLKNINLRNKSKIPQSGTEIFNRESITFEKNNVGKSEKSLEERVVTKNTLSLEENLERYIKMRQEEEQRSLINILRLSSPVGSLFASLITFFNPYRAEDKIKAANKLIAFSKDPQDISKKDQLALHEILALNEGRLGKIIEEENSFKTFPIKLNGMEIYRYSKFEDPKFILKGNPIRKYFKKDEKIDKQKLRK